MFDEKVTKRLATRAEITTLVGGLVNGTLDRERLDVGDGAYTAQRKETVETFEAIKVGGALVFADLIAKNIVERGMTEQEAKSYRKGWSLKSFSSS